MRARSFKSSGEPSAIFPPDPRQATPDQPNGPTARESISAYRTIENEYKKAPAADQLFTKEG